MGTTQKGIIARAIGMLFAAGSMGQNGGFHVPHGTNFVDGNGNNHFRGSSKSNNKQPAKPKFSFVRRSFAGYGIFRNLSTGKEVSRKIATTAGALGSSARSLTPSVQYHFGL